MKSFLILLLLIAATFSFSVNSFEGLNDGTSLKIFNRIDCSTGMTCTRGANGKFVVTSIPAVADIPTQSEGLNITREAIFDYDFAVDGGAISTITTGVSLPAKAVIEKCWFRVETQIVDGGSGTIAVQCEDANNILSAADQSGVTDGDFLASAIVGTAATMVDDIAASCDISFVIGGATISAGKLRGWCRYSVHP